MANNQRIHPLVFTIAFLFVPLFYASFAAIFSASWGSAEIPEWTFFERIVTAVLAFIVYSSPVFIERLILSKSGEKLKHQGKNPDVPVLIYGYCLLSIPPFIALAFSWLGCPVIDVYIYSALSFLAIILWSRHKRNVLSLSNEGTHESTDSPATIKTVTPVTTVRSYTILLFLMGALFFLFIVFSVFILMLPPEYHSTYNQMNVIVWTLVYIVMTIGCWCAAFLRIYESSYALPVTAIMSYLLIILFPFGTAAFIYWIGWVRKKERRQKTRDN